MSQFEPILVQADEWGEAVRWAGAFLAGFKSTETRRSYRRDLDCWFAFCAAHDMHPYRGLRRTHVEVYLRGLEAQEPAPANATLYRRVATLSSWFRWLEDEDLTVGNPAARIRRPQRHPRPQPWLNRNEQTDLLAAAEDEGGDAYALVCLLGLNGLRVSEACNADVNDLGGPRYQPTLQILGKGDKPGEVVLNPRTQQALDEAVDGRIAGPLLRNQWRRRMQPHNAAAVLRRLAGAAGITRRVTPPRAATLLHHHRTTARRSTARCAVGRTAYKGRHHRRL